MADERFAKKGTSVKRMPWFVLFGVIMLGLAACADTISSSEVTPSSQLLKEYDKTLTKSEQKAAISDLEAAQAKARGEASPESTGATGAKSAETQD
jgi:hypothetical protein